MDTSFLGSDSDTKIVEVKAGFLCLGGGGSHAVQQLAHRGGSRAVLVNADVIEDSNLNRLVGGTMEYVAAARPKVGRLQGYKRADLGPQGLAAPKITSSSNVDVVSHRCCWFRHRWE